MKKIKKALSERNLVIILFIMVFAAFSFAQRETKQIEKLYMGYKVKAGSPQYTKAVHEPATRLPIIREISIGLSKASN